MEALIFGAVPPPDVRKGAARGFPRAAPTLRRDVRVTSFVGSIS